jgi:predicted TIM-barrel fold metal-dependent hydrolase
LNLLFGHPSYYPIYEAAVELELPVVIQVGCDSAANLSTPPMAGGVAGTYGEYLSLASQPLMGHVANLVLQGVFDRFPTLKVLLVGGGLAWVPAFLWRTDLSYKFESTSVPWLKRPPTDYIHEHVYFSTYQLERAPQPEVLERYLETVPWLADRVVFTSGYPSFDMIGRDEVASRLPESWHERVFHSNAEALFRWPRSSAGERLASAGRSRA